VYPWLCSPDFASRNNFCGYLFNVTYSCSITKKTKLFLWWTVRSWCLYVIYKLCTVFWRGKKSIKLGIFALTSPSGIILLLRMLSLQLDSPPWKGNDASWVRDSIALPIYPPAYRMDWDHSRFRALVLALFVGGFNFMLSSVSFFSVAETSQVKLWVPGWANSNPLLKNMDWDCIERPWAWKIMHYCGLCLLKVTWRTEEERTWNEGDVQRGATVKAKRGSFLVTAMPFSSVQSLSHVWLFATPWTAAHHAFLSFTNLRSLPKLMSIESVMPSNHLILCHPLLLLPSIFPSIRVFSNESVLCIRWPKYWEFRL